MPKTFLTNAELCEILRCSHSTLWRMRRDIPGFPHPYRLRRRLLWSTEQVVKAMALVS